MVRTMRAGISVLWAMTRQTYNETKLWPEEWAAISQGWKKRKSGPRRDKRMGNRLKAKERVYVRRTERHLMRLEQSLSER